MTNKVIRLIRPVENGAEKEYVKEFFRFIGCFFSDKTIDPRSPNDWLPFLYPNNERGNIEIIVNFFGDDPSIQECHVQGITRIYCYFDFIKKHADVLETPLPSEQFVNPVENASEAEMRKTVLNKLIDLIWRNEPETLAVVRNIAGLYTDNPRGDLFHYLQVKRSLQFLTMGDVLSEPAARVQYVRLSPYLIRAIEALWFLFLSLESYTDPYSKYTRIKAASMISGISRWIHPNDQAQLYRICFPFFDPPFHLLSAEELIGMLRELIDEHPHFLSAHLRMASIYRSIPNGSRSEELCYLRILQSVSNSQPDYAFIWHRCGYFFEKKYKDIEKAKEFYRSAIKVDPYYYQSLFKLGYFAAADGRFEEAESLLNRTIQAIFCNRSTDQDINGMYENWLCLSLKDSQYVFKTYMLLAKIAIRSNREYSAKAFVGKACLAATRFEEAGLVLHASDEIEFQQFKAYHQNSDPVWAIWHVLKPWSEGIVRDEYVRDIVRNRIYRWKV